MRIALVTHKVDFQDGQGRVNFEIAKAALERGHQVTIVGEVCSPEIANHPQGRFVRIDLSGVKTQLLKDMVFARKSGAWIKAHRGEFDVIQANGFVMWEPADVVAVHFVHSGWLANAYYPYTWGSFKPYAWYQRLYSMLNARFEQGAFRSAKKLAAVSKFTASEVANLGLPADRIEVVYNGVDTTEFQPGESVRAEFGLPEGVPMGLFVGDIKTTRKNLETVLKAMQSVPEFHLAVAGRAEGSPYPAVAEELKVRDRVHFIGKTSKIAKLMRSVDMFVFPSRYEAHPLVLMEALASGIPVVVSGNFGAADYVGGGGWVFDDPNDVGALAEALRELSTNPERRRIMGEAARKVALSMQWPQTASGYLKVYDQVVANKILQTTGRG